jgi:hypothetical protein
MLAAVCEPTGDSSRPTTRINLANSSCQLSVPVDFKVELCLNVRLEALALQLFNLKVQL